MAALQNTLALHNCSPQAIPYPTVFGAQFLSVEASLVQNYSQYVPSQIYPNHDSINATNLRFCNVTVTHTHPGQNDTLITQVWLPIAPKWNERMQAIGGGGWVAGLFYVSFAGMAGAVAEGYAAPWNVNLYALQDFASVSLNDAIIIGKSLINSYYGQPPKYSYWSGCSQGGRQGVMLAQRYPNALDGIAASAPAINWPELFGGMYFPQQVMNEMGSYPHPCELDALTIAAIKACDSNDGLADGIISDPDACHFDPYSLIGSTINCHDSNTSIKISKAAAVATEAAWTGVKTSNGSFLWFTPGYEANLTNPQSSPAVTECSTNGTCTGQPQPLGMDWMKLFIKKDPTFNAFNMTRREYEHMFHAGVREYQSIIGTSYPDLTEFRDAGGKMIAYHGLADEVIPFRSSRQYYDAVTAVDPLVHEYYRLFEAPGLAHCNGGAGAYPAGTFDALVEWVEKGIVPETLRATAPSNQSRILCPYPQMTKLNSSTGDEVGFESFYCS
ncbi:tannase and feruloyl esterase [Zopfia rhizophila CBS 207.26]|uniref:Carboxylic ester hydrolase n=1 Tax=Zopfia rhizophila CBS 207.26 TaxID=1314779 RepID=A0A6A6EWS1_9PEZI|nr:tannase and feruloyl esterase [Zopfia rhizophila CBS 207.26]